MRETSRAGNGLGAVLFAVVLVFSLVAASVTFTGSVAAANEPTATLSSVDGETDSSVVTGGESITVTYNATDDGTVQSATVQFLQDSSVVKGVDVGGTGASEATTTVTAPAANGTYNVQLIVTDSDGNTVPSEDTVELTVDTSVPGLNITAPSDGVEEITKPTIAADATDDVGVDTVEFAIEQGGEYYNGSAWERGKVWLGGTEDPASGTYSLSDGQIPAGNGTYTVTARVTDEAGHVRNTTDGYPDSSKSVPYADGTVSYTLDPEAPSLTNVTVATADGGTVTVGDNVTITANASDVTSGVASVTVNASALGGSETLTLENVGGDRWETTLTVASLTVPDGPRTLDATATDAFGNTSAAPSNETIIETAVEEFGNITVGADFVGIVDDGAVRVTASGVADANGNPIDVSTVDVSIAGQTPFSPVPVDNGTINATIDPTKLDNTTAPLGDRVEVSIDGATGETAGVELVHEVRTMRDGWHLGGTPKPTRDVRLSGEGKVLAYDETDPDDWKVVDTPYMERAGAGYFFDITEEARAGYIFDDAASERTMILNDGDNLVGVLADVGASDGNTTLGAVKNYVNDQGATDISNVDFAVPNDPFGDGLTGFDENTADGDRLPAYSAYYINVSSSAGTVTYGGGIDGYSPE